MKTIGRYHRFVLIAVLLSLPLALAQGAVIAPGDSKDADPVQAGYVVITPTPSAQLPATSGLVAFETFGFSMGNRTLQAGVLPSAMTQSAILFVNTNGRLARNLGVAIANPGAVPAIVTLTLKDDSGDVLATTDVTIAAGLQVARFVTELFASRSSVPHDLTGTLAISSTVPVAVMGLRFMGENFTTLPATSLSGPLPVPSIVLGPDTIGGPAAIILAQFATGGGWASEIVLANTGTTDMLVRVDIFGQDGKPLVAPLNGKSASSFTGITIPAGGVVTLVRPDTDHDDN